MKRIFTLCTVLLVAATVLSAQETSRKYGVKSGTAKAVTEMMGQKIESTMYFDDYGALEASKAVAGGMEIVTVSRDGKSYMVNAAARQVQEIPVQKSINFLALTPEVVEEYKIKEIGREKVAGKECTKYSAEVSQMGQTAQMTICVWEGFPMKSVTSSMGMLVSVVVTAFSEGEVDASLFEVPTF
ncbi:MAG: DUF4412 domain-containing protein [Bacteroidales bacterium]|nr:DUF4412 domain-containing protein [Bacteroidales bacterium]